MNQETYSVGDQVRRNRADEDYPRHPGEIGFVLESDGGLGTTWRVLVDWRDGRAPAFLDTSRVEHAGSARD